VALLEVEGAIQMGDEGVGLFRPRAAAMREFVRACERVRKDDGIRAILLRVNSPGGSALASDLMWHALGRAKKERPLVVSMSNVAASGGYYVSAVAGARIFANPCTITGSIGVVGGKFEVSRLQERLGIQKQIISVGRHASYHSPSVDFTQEELEKLQADIDASYDEFVRKMAEGRGRDVAAIERVAQGRVWTGESALENGLVDQLGGIRDALDAARKELGLAEGSLIALEAQERAGLMQRVRKGIGRWPAAFFDLDVPEELRLVLSAPSRETLCYRLPFDFRVL
jgi:protease-4